MTTSPVVTITDELVAELDVTSRACAGWPNDAEWKGAYDGQWFVGSISEDGDKYDVLEIEVNRYDAEEHAELLGRFYAAANPRMIAALLSERAELKRDAERYRWLRDTLRHDSQRWADAGEWNHSNIGTNEFDTAIDQAMQERQE